ncbi:MAG TPA: Gfo/Idh/MocA family oxidoreductase, partial [Bacteroidota bacterium]|nr:Gfo/Idh/MocA family oxidoreductase [Bacteroidota bacterium]
ATAAAKDLGISVAFDDWTAVIDDPNIDAVTIATPPSVQPEIAIAALTHRKHVFCEKPLALSFEAAQRMAATADREGFANMVDFEFPEIEPWKCAKQMLDDGELGALNHISISWNVQTYANKNRLSSWKTNANEGGGALFSFVSHCFYYLEWFVGPAKRISTRLFSAPDDKRAVDTLAVVWFEMESGLPVSLNVSTDALFGGGHRIEFYGADGTLILENRTSDYARGFRLLHGRRISDRLEEVQTAVSARNSTNGDGRTGSVARIVGRFVDWIETGVPSSPSFREGARVQLLLEAARRSHDSGTWVDLADVGLAHLA